MADNTKGIIIFNDDTATVRFRGVIFDVLNEKIIACFICENKENISKGFYLKYSQFIESLGDEDCLCELKGIGSSAARCAFKKDYFESYKFLNNFLFCVEIDDYKRAHPLRTKTYYYNVNTTLKTLKFDHKDISDIKINSYENDAEMHRHYMKRKKEHRRQEKILRKQREELERKKERERKRQEEKERQEREAERKRQEEQRRQKELERKQQEERERLEKERQEKERLRKANELLNEAVNPVPLKPCYDDDNDIYYFQPYFPLSTYAYKNEDEIESSKMILHFKDGDANKYNYEIAYYINLMARGIAYFMTLRDIFFFDYEADARHRIKKWKYALVAVPPSSKQEIGTIRKCIYIINKYCKLKAEIIDAAMLLRRVQSIRSAARSYGNRPSYEESKNSIRVDGICDKNTVYIILDDVTTKGTIMRVCQDLLIENGALQENIYKLALAKTMH